MTRKPKTISFWRGRLPHWEVEGGLYFITLHLAGAIPVAGRQRLRQLSQELERVDDRHAPSWIQSQRAIFAEMERWLDRAPHIVHLQRHDIATLVMDAIDHRQRLGRWKMLEYVVMPTHVHLFCELGDNGLKETLQDFKRWTGHAAVKMLGVGKPSRFWQRDWFDHWSRSDEEDEKIARYIRENPVKAGLVRDYREWPYGSWSQ